MLNGLLQPSHLFVFLIVLIAGAIYIFPWWLIFRKAGFPAPLALLMFVPLANLVMLYWLAFANWPNVPRRTL